MDRRQYIKDHHMSLSDYLIHEGVFDYIQQFADEHGWDGCEISILVNPIETRRVILISAVDDRRMRKMSSFIDELEILKLSEFISLKEFFKVHLERMAKEFEEVDK